MTMAEPSCQSTDCKVGNESSKDGQINQPESSDVPGQEVENANSGGGGTEELINGDLSDYNNFSGAKVLSKEETRGVYFDDRLVTGYLDPPDPWKHVVGWNSEQIAYKYRRSCDKHGTKPLAKLLPQIQNMIDNGKRIECLNLKGEKLDHKHCECIEEILKCVQFDTIDLEGSHLDDECAVALFDMIEYYDSACHLNISFNKNIGVRGWQACSRLIRKTPHLTYLDMRNCDLNERSVPIVGRALKLGSTLTVLHMENIYLSGRSLMIMVAALKMNEILEELFLADNKLMPSDGIQLGTLLKFNHHLQLLDVRNNHIQDVGTTHLCDGLFDQNLSIGLKTLVLWNNGITYQSMEALGKALSSTESLVTLNLGHNNITNEGIHRVKDGLLKSKSLLRFGLQGVKVTCEGAVALAEFVADSPRLLRLDLRENEIKTAGLMALSLAMRVNETVTRIDLDKETKKESGMKDYAVQQRRLHHEIITYMDRNQKLALQQEEAQNEESLKQVESKSSEIFIEPSESESASDESSTDTDNYIPSAEKIQRPKLLFSHDNTPQQTLESPHDFQQLSNEDIPTSSNSNTNLTLHLGPSHVSKPFITTPPTELLLSPQYAPQLTAKKIFSVSKVSESSSSSNMVGSSGREKVTSAVTLCQNLATETVEGYIEQIVSEVVHKCDVVPTISDQNDCPQNEQHFEFETKCDTFHLLTDDMGGSSVDCNKDDNHRTKSLEDGLNVDSESVDLNQSCEKISQLPVDAIHSDAVQFDEGVSTTKHSDTELVETRLNDGCDMKVSNSGTSSVVSNLSSMPATLDSEANSQSVIGPDSPCDTDSSVMKDDKTGISKNTNLVSSGEVKTPVEVFKLETGDVENEREAVVSQSNTDTNDKEVVTGTTFLANNSVQNTDSLKNNSKTDSGIGSYENDQWLKVDSELSHQSCSLQASTENQQTEKPNFHSNLSVNGLARELASVLDALDEQVETSYAGVELSSPDEFEKELDAMLANVYQSRNTWPFLDVPKEVSEKTCETTEDQS